jgi:hypothetical protein
VYILVGAEVATQNRRQSTATTHSGPFGSESVLDDNPDLLEYQQELSGQLMVSLELSKPLDLYFHAAPGAVAIQGKLARLTASSFDSFSSDRAGRIY